MGHTKAGEGLTELASPTSSAKPVTAKIPIALKPLWVSLSRSFAGTLLCDLSGSLCFLSREEDAGEGVELGRI